MRSALSPLVSNLKTDTSTQLCSFTVNLDELDIAGKLNEFSKTNKHIAGWSLVKQEPVPPTEDQTLDGLESAEPSNG